jgi:hypothetical protein
VRVYTTKWFTRYARRQGISERALCEAIERAEQDLVDAQLGRGLIKQRVARKGEGRSGGFRTLIAYRAALRAVFLYGFAKSERGNVSAAQLQDLQVTAQALLGAGDPEIQAALIAGDLREVECDEKEDQAQPLG